MFKLLSNIFSETNLDASARIGVGKAKAGTAFPEPDHA